MTGREVEGRVSQGIDRRTFLRNGGLTFAGLQAIGVGGLGAWLASCGSDSKTSAGSGAASVSEDGVLTLRMPFLQDMQIPDPDIMYEGEGLQVMLSAYEGLTKYEPTTGKIIPSLAESWTVSEDLLTYTFKLVPNVKFHDGTPADADAWVKSFKRRLDVNQGPAYMVAFAKSTAAPDPTTFVVTLKEPNDAFLDYLACPWSPFAVSPTAVTKNAVKDDLAQEWLKTHDAGTGPYVISEFVPASHYTLDVFPDYWGTAPQFKQIIIEITPDVSTQRLKLESGDFDMVTKGFAIEDIESFQKNSDYTVTITSGTAMICLWINATSGIFADKPLRQALLQSIDRESVIKPAYDGLVKLTKNFYSENMFPDGLAPFDVTYDPTVLKGLVDGLSSKKVDMAFAGSGGAPFRRMAELVQVQLSAAGLDVAVREMPTSQLFALATEPPETRPDLLFSVYGPDALHVDTMVRIYLRTGAVPLNWYNYSNAEIDSEMDKALTEPTKDKVNAHYVTIQNILKEEAWVLPFGRRLEAVVSRKGISNIIGNAYLPSIITVAELKDA